MNKGLNTIINLSKADINPASQMLSRVFYNDPINRYAYPDVKEKDTKLPYAYEFLMRYGLKYGLVHTTSQQLEGVAIWLPSDKYAMPFWRLFLSCALFSAIRMRQKAGQRMQRLSKYIENKHKIMASFNHWYLILLGVDPKHQGKGYASKLLREMFKYTDEEGLPCYLETETGQIVSVYQYFEFRVIDELITPETDVNLWVMLWENKEYHANCYNH